MGALLNPDLDGRGLKIENQDFDFTKGPQSASHKVNDVEFTIPPAKQPSPIFPKQVKIIGYRPG